MNDVLELWRILQATPIPNLLVIAGFIFLLLAFVGRIGAIIVLPRKRQRWAGIIGGIFLILGISLSIPSPEELPDVEVMSTQDAQNLSVKVTPSPEGLPDVEVISTQDTQNPSVEVAQSPAIPFTYSDNFGEGLIVHTVEGYKVGDDIEFLIEYTNDMDRELSIFDPPAGETISIQESLPAGTNSVNILVSISDLQKVSAVTVNFYIPNVELTGRIFLDYKKIETIIHSSEQLPDAESSNIPFTYADDFLDGLTIHSIEAHKVEENLEFLFDYTSNVDRGMSFFDPPAGDIISIQEKLSAGTNMVKIIVSIDDLQRVSHITVNFYIPAEELTGAIFLDFKKIESLMQ